MAPVKSVALNRRLGKTDTPKASDFIVKETDEDTNIEDGQVLVKTLFLSVDPYMRYRMSESNVKELPAWEIGKPCDGGGVGVVLASKFDGLAKDDVVECLTWPWKTVCKIEGKLLTKIENEVVKSEPSLTLGLIGMNGLTSLLALQHQGHIEPGKNQTLVVSGAAGACGSAAGQFARILGATNIVGICGSEAKCKYIKEELGYNSAINYKTDDIPASLKSACPNGIDTYFDNVGGNISDEVFKQMNNNSHLCLVGQVSMYNKGGQFPQPLPAETEEIRKAKNIHREAFILFHYQNEWKAAVETLASWYKEGKIRSRETITEGIENIGQAFVSVMTGGNFGKQIVKVA